MRGARLLSLPCAVLPYNFAQQCALRLSLLHPSDQPPRYVWIQEMSSIDGRVLDSWALSKPAGWQPNLLARAIAQQLFISNYTKATWIEDPGEAPICSGSFGGACLVGSAYGPWR